MNPLCKQTVTVYTKRENAVSRIVAENAFYRWWDTENGRACKLILPGENWDLAPGDKVIAGIGPETPDWYSFLPETAPRLTILKRVEAAMGYTLGG